MKSLQTLIFSTIIASIVAVGMYSQRADLQKRNGSDIYHDLDSIKGDLWSYHGKRRHPSIFVLFS